MPPFDLGAASPANSTVPTTTPEEGFFSDQDNVLGFVAVCFAGLFVLLYIVRLILYWAISCRVNRLRKLNSQDEKVRAYIKEHIKMIGRDATETLEEISPFFGGTGAWFGGLTRKERKRRQALRSMALLRAVVVALQYPSRARLTGIRQVEGRLSEHYHGSGYQGQGTHAVESKVLEME